MSEQWKAVPGYEGVYEVSDQGRVRRIRRANNTYPGRILKTNHSQRGYVRVCLCRDNKKQYMSVHRLVMAAFCGLAPRFEVNHKDGNPGNNHLSNLEYVTRDQNERHARDVLNKTTVPPRFYGEKHPQSVLTWETVDCIRRLYETGEYSTRDLGRLYGVSKTTIGHIVFNRAWRKKA